MEKFDDGKNKHIMFLGSSHKMKVFLVLLLEKIPEYSIISESGNLVE